MLNKIKEIEERRRRLFEAGGSKQVERQHQMGKLTARERIDKLFDPGTFQEIDLWIRPIKTGFDIDEKELPGDAIITGFGEIHGRPFYAISEDFTVLGGTFGSGFHHKITRIMEMAVENGIPYIQMIDSGGERIQDLFGRPGFRPMLGGRAAIGDTSTLYHAPMLASGVVPQITLMLGPSYAGSAYSPTMADFYIIRKGTAFMSVASPELLKSVTYQDVTHEEIGGSVLHSTVTGIADFLLDTDEQVIEVCRELVTYIPLNYRQNPPIVDMGDDSNRRDDHLLEIVPEDPLKHYDMHEVIRCIVDKGQFLELQELHAKSILIGFARLDGQTVGIIANNPAESEGILNLHTCDKEARFIRWCDAFNVPLVFLVDTPGFLSNLEEEQSRDGLLRTVPKSTFAICEATVPKIAVYVGKNFGVARLIMGTLRMGVDFAYAWPSARVARINPEEAVDIIYREEIDSSKEPQKVRQDKLAELMKNFMNYPYHAAEQVMVNDITDPRDTRPILIRTLKNLANKQLPLRPWRKHSLMPQ
ncbi:MAG: acyl-CoA carboxylase subunit beta [Thermodesulfobacteriota bacterium]|nr:acyl-CoA carboxylase subunit beta [Thermodesulfobacteriota bacterium]